MISSTVLTLLVFPGILRMAMPRVATEAERRPHPAAATALPEAAQLHT
jgi:hypothetical protein